MSLPPDFRDKVLATLKERKSTPICELCGQNNWSVLDQAVAVNITDLSGNFRLPPPQVPAAAVVCNNCGNLRLHALGMLGLLPAQPPETKKKEEQK